MDSICARLKNPKRIIPQMKCAMFPGQGNQFVGMGKELYQQYAAAKIIYDSADLITGLPIIKVSFEGPEEEQKKTLFTQLITYTNSIAVLETIGSMLKKETENIYEAIQREFKFFAGHSIGEYAALTAAGAITFEQGLEIVRERARLMQEVNEKLNINPGSAPLAAVKGMEKETLENLCKNSGEVSIALYNAPGWYVIGGLPENLKTFCEEKIKGKAKIIYLPVGGPFHTKQYSEIKKEYRAFLEKIEFLSPKGKIISNYSCKPYSKESIVQNLVEQLDNPVQWEQTIRLLLEQTTDFAEMGPGKSLTAMVLGISKHENKTASIRTLNGTASIEEYLFSKKAA